MGVTIRQKGKGKGKPWWVFIAHNGKWKSIKVGDRTAAGATFAGCASSKLTGGFLPTAPCFPTVLMALPTIPKKNRGTGKVLTMQVSTIPTVPTILCILLDAGRASGQSNPFCA